MRRERGGG